MFHDGYPSHTLYVYGALVVALLFLFIFRTLGLFVRPQLGSFGDKIPRLIRATGIGILMAIVLAFIIRTEPPFSRIVAGISFFTITVLVILERYLLFRIEIHLAKHRETANRVLIIGTDIVAYRLKLALKNEPRLRSRVVGFLKTGDAAPDPQIPVDLIKGTVAELERIVERGEVDQVILADTDLPHARMVEIIMHCERGLVTFRLVPDIFGVLTTKVEVQHIGEVPLLGFSKWPLDYFWNRVAKRAEDVLGATLGLILSAPVIATPGEVVKKFFRC